MTFGFTGQAGVRFINFDIEFLVLKEVAV